MPQISATRQTTYQMQWLLNDNSAGNIEKRTAVPPCRVQCGKPVVTRLKGAIHQVRPYQFGVLLNCPIQRAENHALGRKIFRDPLRMRGPIPGDGLAAHIHTLIQNTRGRLGWFLARIQLKSIQMEKTKIGPHPLFTGPRWPFHRFKGGPCFPPRLDHPVRITSAIQKLLKSVHGKWEC